MMTIRERGCSEMNTLYSNCLFFSIIVRHLRGPRLVHGLLVTFIEEETPAMKSLLQDLQHALRMVRRNPGFAAVTILTLALGIATSATVGGCDPSSSFAGRRAAGPSGSA
jgi:hypothetical protein